MKTQILKFDSDLLHSPEKINWIINKIKELKEKTVRVIVVLGAPEIVPGILKAAGTEDPFILVAHQSVFARSSVNLFAEVLSSRGLDSSVLEDGGTGLVVTGNVLDSRIKELDPSNVEEILNSDRIPVISGSFGVDKGGNTTFLGSGGSDAFAVGLAASIEDSALEIIIERTLSGASRDGEFYSHIRQGAIISYQECMEIDVAGGQLLSARVIEMAEKHEIPVLLTPFFADQEGLRIMKKRIDESFAITAVVSDTKTAKIAILGVPDVPGIAAKIFTALAEAQVSAEMIIQSVMRGQINDIAFLVRKEDMETAIEKCRVISREIGAQGVTFDTEIARVSLIGSGIANHPEIPSRMFSILADKGVNLEMIVASSISITCVVDSSREQDAVDFLKTYFMNEDRS